MIILVTSACRWRMQHIPPPTSVWHFSFNSIFFLTGRFIDTLSGALELYNLLLSLMEGVAWDQWLRIKENKKWGSWSEICWSRKKHLRVGRQSFGSGHTNVLYIALPICQFLKQYSSTSISAFSISCESLSNSSLTLFPIYCLRFTFRSFK